MKPTRRVTLLGVLAGGAIVNGRAAAAERDLHRGASGAFVLPYSAVIPFTSRINGVRYELYVRTPAAYAQGRDRLPVIVTLDADYSFPIAANHLEHLADREDQGPDAILVSIAYAGVYPNVDRYHAERTRDYTPFFVAGGGYGPQFQAHSGGGPAFQRVIEHEVLPLIDGRFRSDPQDRTLVGHSYGGLFAAWMLQTRPDMFSRYLIVSPSLWYDEERVLHDEDARAALRLPRKTYVYLGVGSSENGGEFPMADQMQRFAQRLRGRGDPNLIVGDRVFEDETHASIFPAAFSTGVRHLFRVMPG